jgi:hypothetical protein
MEDIKVNTKIKLSALWVSVMFLYIYADILSLFRPGEVQEILEGRMGPFPATQGSLLTASILMIIPALMVFFSLALNVKANRNVNILFGALYTLVNISNLIGETWVYYLVFGVVEIVMTLLIIWHAWKWPNKHAV